VKTVKRKAKSAALLWKEFGLTAGYHSHTAPAAKGSYCITTVTSSRKWMTATRGISAASPGTAVLGN
jgi:hypothetical protein